MSKKIYSLAIAVLISLVAQAQSSYYFGSDEKFDESIPTPEEFFGFPIGSALVRYDRVVIRTRTVSMSSCISQLPRTSRIWNRYASIMSGSSIPTSPLHRATTIRKSLSSWATMYMAVNWLEPMPRCWQLITSRPLKMPIS